MERKFYLVLIITCLFFIPLSPTFFHSNDMQIIDDRIKHTQGQDNGSSTSINITEIGPFESSVETFVAPNNGTEFPVLYLKESFHIDAILSQSNGQSVGDKCLNIYLDPQDNIRPISSINTSASDGMIEWFSGNPSQNPSLRGVETTGGKLEGFRILRVAYEPTEDLSNYGGCGEDSSDTLNGSNMDIVVLVRNRVDIRVSQSWSYVDENGLSGGELVIGEVVLLRDRLDLAIENEKVSFQCQYYSYSEEWVTELVINSTTNEQGIAVFEWEFEGRTCEGQPCPGVWRIIAHYQGSMFFAPFQDNISFELQYIQPVKSDSNVVDAGSEDENWDTAMDIVEISALIISLISLLLYLVFRDKEKDSDLDELAEKIVSKQKFIEEKENTLTKPSGIPQSQEQIPTMETHDDGLKQDLENARKNVTIVQNITYNIQDSSIVGDMNTGINSDTE